MTGPYRSFGGGGGNRGGGGGGRTRERTSFRPYRGARKVDEFARLQIVPDYKDIERLRKYITPQGKILPRRRTGLSAKNQRRLTVAIKRARHMALLPFAAVHINRRAS